MRTPRLPAPAPRGAHDAPGARPPDLRRGPPPQRDDELRAAPHERPRDVTARLDLPWGSHFEKAIDDFGLESRNATWPATLGVERVAALREMAPEFLARCEHDGA